MANGSDDEIERLHDQWRAGKLDDLAWFKALRDPITRGARAGIHRMTGATPQTADVDDAVFRAFEEFFRSDPNQIRKPLGLARRIAFRRGQDVGRRLNRIREFESDEEDALAGVPDPMATDPEDEVMAVERAAHLVVLTKVGLECLEQLPPGQAEVVRATVMGDQELSDWANEKGKSYQAADQQRDRALAALVRCVESKLDGRERGGYLD